MGCTDQEGTRSVAKLPPDGDGRLRGLNPDRNETVSKPRLNVFRDGGAYAAPMSSTCTLHTPTASVAAVKATLAAAERLGLSRQELLSDVSIGAVQWDDDDGRVPLRQLVALDEGICARLGRGCAIRIGEFMADHPLSIVEYLAQCSRTLRELFESMSRYRALVMEVGAPVLEIHEGFARFGCVHPQQTVDFLGVTLEKDMATWLARARQLMRQHWDPVAVHFQTPESDQAEYARFFRAPVHNGSSGCWLVFDADLLDTPLPGGNGSLMKHLRPIADALLARLTSRASFARTVRDALMRLVPRGACCIEDVARELAVSARTLQRRLEAEGTTFGAVFDDARRATALEYLRNPQIAIKEAAFRVGFSEPSTFYRAFRRWTGATPADYRRSLAV
jgi:AraC-like DNA-binding protein